MRWSDLNLRPQARVLRQFAFLWLIFFTGLGAFRWAGRGDIETGVALTAIGWTVGLLGLILPGALRLVYVACITVSFPIGWVLSQVMLVVLFYGIITPVALLLRLRGRDVLQRRYDPNRKSMWIPKPVPREVDSYFRQY